MYDHLILVSKEHMIGSEIANLIYTEVKVRASKNNSSYIKNKDYEPLVERELNDKEIENFKANRHLYTKVQENEHGTIYQFGADFKEMYWKLFPKVEETPKEIFEDKEKRTHKICSKCKLKLPSSEFYVRSNGQLYEECKECKKKRRNYKKKGVKQ